MKTTSALYQLFPDIVIGRDVEIATDKNGVDTITAWRRSEPQPSVEQLAAVEAQLAAQESALATMRAGLITAWEQTFTAGERSFFKSIFDDALAAFDRGDIVAARDIVATAPSISSAVDAKQAFIVGLFPKLTANE